MDISVIGTGKMGSAFVRRAASLGFATYCWNRSVEKLKSLPCRPLEKLEDAKGLVVIFLFDDKALYQIAPKVGGDYIALAGTYSIEAVVHVLKILNGGGRRGFAMPVLGSPRNVESGDAIYIVGANGEVYRVVEPILKNFGILIEVGDSIKATALKLAYNALLISTVAVLGESVSLVKRYGVDVEVFKLLLSHTVFKEVANRYIDRMLSNAAPSFTIEGAAKDLRYATYAAGEAGVGNIATSGVRALYEALAAMGKAYEDYVKAGVIESGHGSV
ncbi:MAG: NAD(P)-dependent oxidoreductase [Pyrobaculum sp.]